ncbi:MAG: cation transporter [Clostridia bacterium]|nr:cation transporter [Clostridia bacterium]
MNKNNEKFANEAADKEFCTHNNFCCNEHHDKTPQTNHHLHSHPHHSHSHHTHHHSHSSSEKNISTAFFLNLFFVFIEIAGGIITNSFAIISDAIHDLGDCGAIGLAFFFEKFSRKKPDKKYTYGYKRYSLLSAIITSLILVIGSVAIIFGSIQRFKNPEEIKSLPMLIIAVFGVLINGIAAFKTSHGSGANEKAINLHMLEDVFGWIAVLTGSIFIHLFQWYFIDTLLSLVISAFLLFHSAKNILYTVSILLEKTPYDFNFEDYEAEISKLPGVENVHHIHVWSLDDETILATIHITLSKDFFPEKYSEVQKSVIEASKNLGINHITLQIDIENSCCDTSCEI